jgi:phage FluMu protein Com
MPSGGEPKMRGEKEPVELVCPKCREVMIVYLPIEELPRCPNPECDGTRMIIEELLDEGKSY